MRVRRPLTYRSTAANVGYVHPAAVAASYAIAASTLAHPSPLNYVPAPPTIRYVAGTAPGLPQDAMAPAATDTDSGTVYYSQPLDKFERAHETGHVFDAQALSDGDRRYFQRLMQAPSGAWVQGTGYAGGGLHSPNEWFADYYAAAATGMDPTRQGVSSYAPIGPKRLKQFEAALARLGKRKHYQPYQP